MPQSNNYQRTRLSLFFGIFTAISVVVIIGLAGSLLLLGRPHAAVITMGAGLCFMGVMRGIWPGYPWFGSRNRVADVIVYLLLGGAVLFFASAANTLSPQ